MGKTKKPKKDDPLETLKYRAYCRALTAPGEDTTLEDFITFAKFFLCKLSHRLWKDPIWDEYTDEEILIEYFSHLFSTDKAARAEFEVQAFSGKEMYGEDIYDWLDRKMDELKVENEKKLEEMPDKVSFSPETNKDHEE